MHNNEHIHIWTQYMNIYKSISNPADGTVCIYDCNDNLILKRTCLTRLQVTQIEYNIKQFGIRKKKVTNPNPFKFLDR